jgi:hypothetical protein
MKPLPYNGRQKDTNNGDKSYIKELFREMIMHDKCPVDKFQDKLSPADKSSRGFYNMPPFQFGYKTAPATMFSWGQRLLPKLDV